MKVSSKENLTILTSLLFSLYVFLTLRPVLIASFPFQEKIFYLTIFCLLVLLLAFSNIIRADVSNYGLVFFIVGLTIFVYLVKDHRPIWFVFNFPLFLLLLVFDRNIARIMALLFLKLISTILFLGLIVHVALLLGVSLPSFNILHTAGDINGIYYESYIFSNYAVHNGIVNYRFSSVFDEPGLVGTMCAFLLFSLSWKLNSWYSKVILLSGIFSLSMAFIILSFVGFLLVNWKRSIKQAPIFLMCIGLSFVAIKYIFGVNSSIYYYTFGRLLSSNFDNRNVGLFVDMWSYYIDNMSLYAFIFGSDLSSLNMNTESYSILLFIHDYGFGIIFLIITTSIIAFSRYLRKVSYLIPFTVIWLLSMYQRPDLYRPIYITYAVIFSLSSGGFLGQESHKKDNNK